MHIPGRKETRKYPKYSKPKKKKMLPGQRRHKKKLYLLSEVDFFFSVALRGNRLSGGDKTY